MGATAAVSLAAMQLGQGYAQSRSIEAQGEYQASMLDISAGFSDLKAEDAIKRGKRRAREIKKKARQIIGSQRVSLAGQGISLSDGSALAIQEDTAEMAELDAITTKNNAWKEAWGHRVKSFDLRNQSRLAKMASQSKARNTMMTSGLSAATTFYKGSKIRKTPTTPEGGM